MSPKVLFSAKFLGVFHKKDVDLRRGGTNWFINSLKIKTQITISLAAALNTGLLHAGNTYCVWGKERHFCHKARLRIFLEIKFF